MKMDTFCRFVSVKYLKQVRVYYLGISDEVRVYYLGISDEVRVYYLGISDEVRVYYLGISDEVRVYYLGISDAHYSLFTDYITITKLCLFIHFLSYYRL